MDNKGLHHRFTGNNLVYMIYSNYSIYCATIIMRTFLLGCSYLAPSQLYDTFAIASLTTKLALRGFIYVQNNLHQSALPTSHFRYNEH